MKSKWFDDVFLPSVTERMESNKKYPNTMILSEKQEDICLRYMEPKQCYGDYGYFTNYTYSLNGYKYLLYKQGRYSFLSCRIDKRAKSEE